MENKKKNSRGKTWFQRLFMGNKKELSFLEEEQLQSPLRSIVNNFFSKKTAVFGLVMFILILLFVSIGPIFLPIDLSYQDNTQLNVPPSMGLMTLPKGLEGHVRDISPGTTFAVGVSDSGKVYVWGYTKITDTLDVGVIPEEVQNANIVQIAAGYDHVVALDDQGQVYVWGNDRLGQAEVPEEAQGHLNVKQLEAGFQYSALLTEEGELYLWGNPNMADLKCRKKGKSETKDEGRVYQGNIDKIAVSSYAYVTLLKDGSVAYTGYESNAFSNYPDSLRSDVVDIAASGATCAAVKSDGTVVVWGNVLKNEGAIPEHSGKIVQLYGGRYHYTALLENGDVMAWGDDLFGQSTVPEKVNQAEIVDIFAGFYQNYAVTDSGEMITWGLKGYLLGTDNFGRDMLTRIVNGGKMTMTVGAVAVIISLVIGVILGGVSGYFGGKADIIIMRIAEVIGGLPFIPFAMILSAVIGTRISLEQRMYLIMVVLGVLSWPSLCRLVRAQIFAEREKEFVVAAQAMGVKESKIVFKHILPNVISVVLVSITLDFATCMLTESTLSYLGFGIPAPTPTWGNMLTGANNSIVIQQYWWRWVFPALIFGVCTICINLIGDGLRDAIDPKSAER